jgi:hypothetical protein
MDALHFAGSKHLCLGLYHVFLTFISLLPSSLASAKSHNRFPTGDKIYVAGICQNFAGGKYAKRLCALNDICRHSALEAAVPGSVIPGEAMVLRQPAHTCAYQRHAPMALHTCCVGHYFERACPQMLPDHLAGQGLRGAANGACW